MLFTIALLFAVVVVVVVAEVTYVKGSIHTLSITVVSVSVLTVEEGVILADG